MLIARFDFNWNLVGFFFVQKRQNFCAFISAPLINYWVVRDGDKSERRIISKIGDKISASFSIKLCLSKNSRCNWKWLWVKILNTILAKKNRNSIASENFNLIDKKNWTLKQMLIYRPNQMHTHCNQKSLKCNFHFGVAKSFKCIFNWNFFYCRFSWSKYFNNNKMWAREINIAISIKQ